MKVRMRLDDEDSEDGLKLVSGSYGMDVPSACTIVIIAGRVKTQKEFCVCHHFYGHYHFGPYPYPSQDLTA